MSSLDYRFSDSLPHFPVGRHRRPGVLKMLGEKAKPFTSAVSRVASRVMHHAETAVSYANQHRAQTLLALGSAALVYSAFRGVASTAGLNIPETLQNLTDSMAELRPQAADPEPGAPSHLIEAGAVAVVGFGALLGSCAYSREVQPEQHDSGLQIFDLPEEPTGEVVQLRPPTEGYPLAA